MARIIALDYGKKRTGIAVTDPMQIVSSPLTAVTAEELTDFLTDYFKKEEVETLVLGYPTQADGSPTDTTADVLELEAKLRDLFPDLEICLEDEYASTKEAMQMLIAGDTKKKKRRKKENTDMLSAVVILRRFLESRGDFF